MNLLEQYEELETSLKKLHYQLRDIEFEIIGFLEKNGYHHDMYHDDLGMGCEFILSNDEADYFYAKIRGKDDSVVSDYIKNNAIIIHDYKKNRRFFQQVLESDFYKSLVIKSKLESELDNKEITKKVKI